MKFKNLSPGLCVVPYITAGATFTQTSEGIGPPTGVWEINTHWPCASHFFLNDETVSKAKPEFLR